jgi:hypothetical protein
VDVADKPHVMIATPCKDGRVDVNYATSLMATGQVFTNAGIPYASLHICTSSIDNARNILATYFLKSPCTHLLFVDDDMAWAPDLPLRMLNENVDIVGVPYRKKKVKPEYTIKLGGQRIASIQDRHHMVVAVGIGMGMTLIRKNVFEKMKDKVTLYHCYGDTFKEPQHMFFRHELVTENGKTKYESEDFHFCRLARESGFEVFAYVDEVVPHIGRCAFKGSYSELLGEGIPHGFTSKRERLMANLVGIEE